MKDGHWEKVDLRKGCRDVVSFAAFGLFSS